MGWTVSGICSSFVGNEGINFVSYHVRRTYCTLIAHAMLLLGYLVGLAYVFYPQMRAAAVIYGLLHHPVSGRPIQYTPSNTTKILLGGWCAGVVVVVVMLLLSASWRVGNWKYHPIVRALDVYPEGWRAAARSVEADFQRLDKVMVPLGNRIVVIADTWIMQTGVYVLCT